MEQFCLRVVVVCARRGVAWEPRAPVLAACVCVSRRVLRAEVSRARPSQSLLESWVGSWFHMLVSRPGAFRAPGGSNCSGVVSERSRLDCVTPACSQQRRERVWAWLSLSEGSHVPVWKKLSRGAPFGVPCTGRRNLSLGAVLLTCRRGVRAPWCRVGAPCSRASRVCACPDVCYVQKSVVRALPSLS